MAGVVLIFLLIVGGGVVALVMFVSADGAAREAHGVRARLVDDLAAEHDLLHAVAAGDVIIGVKEGRHALFYKLADQPHLWLSIANIAAVELRPVFERRDESTATTTTSRGSQLIGAGVGMAIAGPVGALIGGTTGARQTTSRIESNAVLRALELEMRVRDARRPRLIVSISQPLPSGSIVPPALEERSRNLAAFLATAIEDAGSTGPESREQGGEPHAAPIAWPSQPLAVGERRGWWQRTFGA